MNMNYWSLLPIFHGPVIVYFICKTIGHNTCTVKSLIEARAFIRIITFSGEGGGRLLEAVVLANYV